MMLKNVRLSFADIFQPSAMSLKPNSDGTVRPKYSCTLILPLDHPQLEQVKAEINQVGLAKWGEQWEALKQGPVKLCLRRGEEKAHIGGFGPGVMFFNASNTRRPTVVDRSKQQVNGPDDPQAPYSGCYVNAMVDFWAQSNQHGKRVNASLSGLQFYADGEQFGGGAVATADDFDDFDDVNVPPAHTESANVASVLD